MPTVTSQDGTTIYYEATGSGDPVVLVHGITESGRNWDPIAERLSGRHRVVVPDLRGHGRSGEGPTYALADLAGDVGTMIVAEGLDRPRLVGIPSAGRW